MILLDTDHLTVASYPRDPRYAALSARMQSSGLDDFATTIVSVEEQMRGWLAVISKARDLRQLAVRYDQLIAMIDFFSRWSIVRFDDAAADEFDRLRKGWM